MLFKHGIMVHVKFGKPKNERMNRYGTFCLIYRMRNSFAIVNAWHDMSWQGFGVLNRKQCTCSKIHLMAVSKMLMALWVNFPIIRTEKTTKVKKKTIKRTKKAISDAFCMRKSLVKMQTTEHEHYARRSKNLNAKHSLYWIGYDVWQASSFPIISNPPRSHNIDLKFFTLHRIIAMKPWLYLNFKYFQIAGPMHIIYNSCAIILCHLSFKQRITLQLIPPLSSNFTLYSVYNNVKCKFAKQRKSLNKKK